MHCFLRKHVSAVGEDIPSVHQTSSSKRSPLLALIAQYKIGTIRPKPRTSRPAVGGSRSGQALHFLPAGSRLGGTPPYRDLSVCPGSLRESPRHPGVVFLGDHRNARGRGGNAFGGLHMGKVFGTTWKGSRDGARGGELTTEPPC